MNSIEMHAQIFRFFIPKAQYQQEHSKIIRDSLKDILIDTIDNINNKIPENLALKLTITLGNFNCKLCTSEKIAILYKRK